MIDKARLHASVQHWTLDITGFSSVEPARNFYYVDDGGQDVLFPFARLSLRLELSRHRVELLYQPIELDTRVALAEPLTVDGLTITFTSANGEQLSPTVLGFFMSDG